MRIALLLGLIAVATLIPLVLLLRPAAPPTHGSSTESFRTDAAVYVWQRHWTPAVVTSVEKAIDATDTVMVLGAECAVENNELRCGTTSADWRLLGESNRSLWIVLRAQRVPAIETAAGQRAAAQILSNAARAILDRIPKTDAPVVGVQVDYDCATDDLDHYAALLRALREQLQDVPISITALPAWLRQPEMAHVLEGLDHFVLQVHSLDPTSQLDDPVTLCDVSRIPEWTKDAVRLKTPFYVALPTYGYRLMFDVAGHFVGLGAEEAEETFAGSTVREIHADPREMASVVRDFDAAPPSHWRGFVWFRMPVQGDRLNWTWPVLDDVMNGRAPQTKLKAEVRNPSPDLYEVWVINSGAYRPTEPTRLSGDWEDGQVVARDAVGGFRFTNEALETSQELVGPAPYPGEETMAAWFRLAPSHNDYIARFDLIEDGVAP